LSRVRQKDIKRIALELVDRHEDQLSSNFKKNREFIDKTLEVKGKVLRNRITGYVTSLIKQKERK
jgi:small subunit ribosomal protein S17e